MWHSQKSSATHSERAFQLLNYRHRQNGARNRRLRLKATVRPLLIINRLARYKGLKPDHKCGEQVIWTLMRNVFMRCMR